jgi:DNA-binding FadR family transcriptional regulator
MSSQTFDAVRVPKAAEIVASTLRMQIITGVLEQDASLPSENVLMEQFGVSRPTLREAFRILESESLIDVRRGARGGARVRVPDGSVASRHVGYVLQFSATTMKDVYAARTMLETPLGALAAERATADDLDRLDAKVQAAEGSVGNAVDFVEHDIAFHLLVADIAGNHTMRTMVDMLYGVVVTARRRYADALPPGDLSKQQREVQKTHSYIVEHIRSGKREAATQMWLRHLNEVERSYDHSPLAATVVEMMG